MKKCVGCVHLPRSSLSVCRAGMMLNRQVDPYTGRIFWENNDGNVLKYTLAEMRKEGGDCGPDRKLYEPTFFAKWFPKLYD